MQNITISTPVETASALVIACVAIEDILHTGKLTEDITEELKHIQPYLDTFIGTA